MRFYYVAWREFRRHGSYSLPDSSEFPCVVLIANSWDDYGYRTTFDIAYLITCRRPKATVDEGAIHTSMLDVLDYLSPSKFFLQ